MRKKLLTFGRLAVKSPVRPLLQDKTSISTRHIQTSYRNPHGKRQVIVRVHKSVSEKGWEQKSVSERKTKRQQSNTPRAPLDPEQINWAQGPPPGRDLLAPRSVAPAIVSTTGTASFSHQFHNFNILEAFFLWLSHIFERANNILEASNY